MNKAKLGNWLQLIAVIDWRGICPRLLFNAACMLIVLFSTSGCVTGQARAYNRLLSWPQTPYAKVIGYSFKGPEMTSVLTKSGIDVEMLKRFTVATVGLSKSQVDRLLGAVRKPEEAFPEMLCYDPHHVFVFYSESDEEVAAIEVCFTCNGILTWPDAGMVRLLSGLRCDLPTLARLANELGLGLGSPEMTLPKYLQKLKRQQADQLRFIKERTEARS